MQIGMIGLGRMGINMAARLIQAGIECVVYDPRTEAVQELEQKGAIGADSLEDLVAHLSKPRVVWLMVPAAAVDDDSFKTGTSCGGGRHYHRRRQFLLP